MEQQLDLPIKQVVSNWNSMLARTAALLNQVSDEDLEQEVSPGRNTGIYLLGHLTAVHDRLLPLLGLGEQKFTHLNDVFLASPDKSGKPRPSVTELRAHWEEVNNALTAGFEAMQPAGWLERHSSVSEEDFMKEPHRNKLNVLLSRTIHLSEHYGQLLFLKKKD